jgi:predicted AAA+ superfamily ATPase
MERNVLKEIALDQRARFEKRARGVEREALEAAKRHIHKPHVVVISGVRRCGKSTLLLQMADRFFDDGFHYFNFEDERLLGFTRRDFSALHEVLIECFGDRRTFLLDEVQNVDSWESFVRRMQDSGCKFVITGSNASLLSSELGTKLTGRHLNVALTPFSFREYAAFRAADVSGQTLLTPQGRAAANTVLESFRTEGGFPERLRHGDPEILATLYEDILYRDVAARHEIKNMRVLRELALYYMSNVAAPCSFNRLKDSLGMGSATTVSSYTGHLEQSYLISTVPVFDSSLKRQAVAPKKVYAVDTGLANSVSLSFSRNTGPLTENLVYMELWRRGYMIYYGKTASGHEVDFVCLKGKEIAGLIQVCANLSSAETKRRKIESLLRAMETYGVTEGLLLADSDGEEISTGGRRIRVVGLSRWLIER